LRDDAAGHRVTELLAVVQEQMADLAVVQEKQAQLRASGMAAEGLVEVTVNASGQLVDTVIDESYLDEHEFDELAGHVTEAARAAAREAARQVAEMLAPISERRRGLPSLSEVLEGAADLGDLMPAGLDPAPPWPDGRDNEGWDETGFPTVRR
jgi:DNA-binding protein YbaB